MCACLPILVADPDAERIQRPSQKLFGERAACSKTVDLSDSLHENAASFEPNTGLPSQSHQSARRVSGKWACGRNCDFATRSIVDTLAGCDQGSSFQNDARRYVLPYSILSNVFFTPAYVHSDRLRVLGIILL